MTDGRATVDLEDLVGDYQRELESIEEEAQDHESDTTEFQVLREEYEEIHNNKQLVEDTIEEWNGSKFTIKTDSSWGDQNLVADLYRPDAQAANRSDSDAPEPEQRFGPYKKRVVEVFTTSIPENAPTDPTEYPDVIGSWLYGRINNAVRFGEVEPKNWQLDRALGRTE